MAVTESSKNQGLPQRLRHSLSALTRRIPKFVLGAVLGLATLIVVLVIASFFVDEPLRRYMEREMNRSLEGYTVSLPGLSFHLLGLSVTLKDLRVTQDAHPDPAVLHLPELHAGIHWREVLRARLVAEFLLKQPEVHVDLTHLREENKDDVPVEERGWQDAVQTIYPLKINLLRIEDGEFTYIDEDPKQPLRVSRLNLRSSNIRNIHSGDREYPSPFYLEAVIFDKGRGVVEGNANFLAEPFPGIQGTYQLDNVALDFFKSVIARSNLAIRKGTFSSSGQVEYAPKTKILHVRDMTIDGMELDYLHTAATAAAEKRRAAKAGEAARDVSNESDVLLRIDRFTMTNSNVGFVNKAAQPDYRVFLADTELQIQDLSNQFRQGPATARLTGRFMGSGSTSASATFRPENKGPDFDLLVSIEETQMTRMNDLLRAYGKFDVVAGVFSFYSEVHVKNKAISGYIKPLFRDLDVYDKRQDEEKNLFRKLYEGVVGGISNLLENQPREEVATKADLSGRLDDPDANTFEVVVRLIQNAFFRAILPGFDRELSGSRN